LLTTIYSLEGRLPTTRSYQDLCGIARALDVVGERWALLVVRELLFGPQRFSEIRRVLANTSSNVVADRLRELEANGVVARRRLAAPAASWVYELTPWGRELEPIVLALGLWGLQSPLPPEPAVVGPTTVLLYLRAWARPDPASPATVISIELDAQRWTAHAHDGRLDIHVGDPTSDPDAVIRTDPRTLRELIGAPRRLRSALHSGVATVSGDRPAIGRLLEQVVPVDQRMPANA
jgi:DNA-binding HxlR family transcriptional regulator